MKTTWYLLRYVSSSHDEKLPRQGRLFNDQDPIFKRSAQVVDIDLRKSQIYADKSFVPFKYSQPQTAMEINYRYCIIYLTPRPL